jgi:membrane protein DedA with SNARE-associated domain
MTGPALPGTLAVIGDSIGWVVRRHGGHRLLTRYGRCGLLTPHRLASAESFFTRHGSKIVPVARFFEGLRPVNGIIAGMTGMPWLKFLGLSAVGAALCCGQ